MNILAHTASRYIKTLGKHELQPNERTLAKDKACDLEHFEKKTDAGKLVLYFIAPWCNECTIDDLSISVNIIIHKSIWKPMEIDNPTKCNFIYFSFVSLGICIFVICSHFSITWFYFLKKCSISCYESYYGITLKYDVKIFHCLQMNFLNIPKFSFYV